MFQLRQRTIPDTPSNVRRTFVQSLGPTSRCAPNSTSWRPPRSVSVAARPSGITKSAKAFCKSIVSTKAALSPPDSSRGVASELLASAKMRKYRLACRSALSRMRDSRNASDCAGCDSPNWNWRTPSWRARTCPPTVSQTSSPSVSGMNFTRSQTWPLKSAPRSTDQSSSKRRSAYAGRWGSLAGIPACAKSDVEHSTISSTSKARCAMRSLPLDTLGSSKHRSREGQRSRQARTIHTLPR
jgi:hypothetical protein